MLHQHGYNNNDINRSLKKPSCHNKSDTTDWLYLKIPFISEQIDRNISKIFQNENLKVRLTHRSHSLRHALPTPNANAQCKRQQCPIAHTGNCFKQNAICNILCTKCNDFYIGSTIRHLHDRIKEHFENSNSSVYKHFITCQYKPKCSKTFISIIAREPDPVNLRLHEAFFIRKLQPTINSRAELTELSELLF